MARSCPGHARMGAGGGMWQRLQLLRAGKHPKDKSWMGTPIPEARWNMQTISAINTAIAETRQREDVREKETRPTATIASSSTKLSRLEQVKLRVKARLQCAESRQTENTFVSTCTGSSSSSTLSRFEALRQQISRTDMDSKGVLHVLE